MNGNLLTLLVLLVAFVRPAFAALDGSPQIVALNLDGTEFGYRYPAAKMTVEGVIEWFDEVVKAGVTHFMACPTGQTAVYDSTVREPCWWDGTPYGYSPSSHAFIANYKLLEDRKIDRFAIWFRRARERGVSPWVSIRMNDVHNIDTKGSWAHSRFWIDHPEFRRVPGATGAGEWCDAALDFAHQEVRDHVLELVRESLDRWDVDGIECDWLRFPHHVAYRHEADGTASQYLTSVMREVRKLADAASRRRGHPVGVCVRVAAQPEMAKFVGTDAVAWAREKLVDLVVPCNFYICSDFQLPMRQWKAELVAANKKVKVLGGCDFAGVTRDPAYRQHAPKDFTLAEVAGYFERLLDGGADGVSYFNRMAYDEKLPYCRLVQIEGLKGGASRLQTMERAYPATFHDIWEKSWFKLDYRFPVSVDRRRKIVIPIGRSGMLSRATVKLAFEDELEDPCCERVMLNGVKAFHCRRTDALSWLGYQEEARRAKAYEFSFPASAVRDGDNTISIDPMQDKRVPVLRYCELFLFPVSRREDWRLGQHVRIEGDLLIVDVPKGAQNGFAHRSVDLTKFPNGVELSVRCRGENISKPNEGWLGSKFMLHYTDDEGVEQWPGASQRSGTFDWCDLRFAMVPDKGVKDGMAELTLGLQAATGKIVFDLSTLRIVERQRLWTVPEADRGYQCVYTPSVANAPRRRGVMLPALKCKEEDFRTLQAWGATIVRYQMCRNWSVENDNRDLAEYDRWLDGKLKHLDCEVLPWAEKYGLDVVVDLHVAPGGRSGSDLNMFYEKPYGDHFVSCWQRIARRFRGRRHIYGYDLINEPNQQFSGVTNGDWWDLQRRAAEAVRAIDPDVTIIIESNDWDSPRTFSCLRPLRMTNIVYQAHMYQPIAFTHQGVSDKAQWTPTKYPDLSKGWDKEFLRRQLAEVRQFQLAHGAKIYIGEFSAIAWAEGAGTYLRDVISLCEEYGWDWSYHAFREWPGWSVEHTCVAPDAPYAPSSDNPRLCALKDGFGGGGSPKGFVVRSVKQRSD